MRPKVKLAVDGVIALGDSLAPDEDASVFIHSRQRERLRAVKMCYK